MQYQRKTLLVLLVILISLVVYDIFFGRVIKESPKWIKRKFAQQLVVYSGALPASTSVAAHDFHVNNELKFKVFSDKGFPERANIVELVNFLNQKDAHYINIGTSNGAIALAAAMKGRKAVVYPRDVSSGQLIWEAVLINRLSNLIRIIQPIEKDLAMNSLYQLRNVSSEFLLI